MFFYVCRHRLHAEAIGRLVEERYEGVALRHFIAPDAALEALREQAPKVLLSDFILNGATACALLRSVMRRAEGQQVVVVTDSCIGMRTLVEHFNISLVHKQSGLGELFRAIDFALDGQAWIDPVIAAKLMRPAESEAGGDVLSEREMEVMQCYLDGMRPEEIAERLFISVKTVRAHKANIMRKIGLRSDFELFRYAARVKMVEECLAA